MRDLNEILRACPSTEPATFSEFLRGLDDVPEKGDKDEWRELFAVVSYAEDNGWIEVERNGSHIESLMLTEAGVARVKRK